MAPEIPASDAELTATIAAFVAAVRESDALQPAQLVKHYAWLLVEADDALAIRNFDRCSWDAGELLWLLKTWEV